jgi:hypothetical protein
MTKRQAQVIYYGVIFGLVATIMVKPQWFFEPLRDYTMSIFFPKKAQPQAVSKEAQERERIRREKFEKDHEQVPAQK